MDDMEKISNHNDHILKRIRLAFVLIGVTAFIIGGGATIYSTYIFSKVVVTEQVQDIGLVDTLASSAWITLFWALLVAEAFIFFLYKFIVSEHKDMHSEHYHKHEEGKS